MMKPHHNKCQCSDKCNRPIVSNGLCKKHIKNCLRKSPISGYEPQFEPSVWNSKKEVRETHNCFSYAMNVHDPKQIKACRADKKCDVPFHQPGAASGHPRFQSRRKKTCPDMIGRLFGDNPTIKMTTFKNKCPAHTSKIALVVDPDEDYHFYRQDSNKMWSHKPGGMPVTNMDSKKQHIYDPALANRNYTDLERKSKLNYDMFCGYMCVPRDTVLHLKVGGNKTRKNKRK